MTRPEILFRALADRTRLRLLALLGSREVCVCDLIEGVKLPQPTVSRHLAYLKRAGLIADRKEGRWRYYSRIKASDPVHAKAIACVDAIGVSAQLPGRTCR